MVTFGSGYYMPMDREYANSSPRPNNESTNDVGVGIGDIGMSLGLGPVPNVQAIASKIRAGAKTTELTFMGAGKGSAQGHTPEYYGKLQRQALLEMQKANEYNFTTHATVGVYGLAGMDQQGNFSKQNKETALNEIQRAIHFAADVAQGGPVVVHTGEFYRPLVDADWNEGNKFKMYAGEEERASFRVVDSRTGGVIQEARKNRKVARPIWNTAEQGIEFTDFDGKKRTANSEFDEKGRLIYLDPFGNRIHDEHRVPQFDSEKGQFKIQQMGWDELEKESKQMTLRAKEVWKDWKAGKLSEDEFQKSYWVRFKEANSEDEIKIKPEEAYIISTLETNAANSRGWAYYYGADFDERVDNIKKLRKAQDFYQKIEEATDEEEKWRLKRDAGRQFGDLVPPESKFPTEIIKRLLRAEEAHLKQNQEGSASQWAQAAEAEETIRHVESAEHYALKEAFDAYARAGISAMEQSKRLEKEGKLKKPVAVAMENLFPESFGSHPDELITLVEGGRKKMADFLVQRGMSNSEAEKKAKDHITATFDTGHLNMWRKYWQGDPSKGIEENDTNFNKWMLGKVEELAQRGVVSHLHLVDNYGYQDDHLAPGQGNTPVKEIVEIFKKHGYKGEMIVEPGADYSTDVSGFHSVMKTWGMFGSSVYGSPGAAPRKGWGEVQYGFFGQNEPPYFTFAPYSPSEEWTLWSGVPLE
ncbi:MAG TPA: TIM barrel protein [Candidatus Nanoarchaeia archaeon]|nr:TIM barrel protein [Candidatus Nanoarchaeia archaeon]